MRSFLIASGKAVEFGDLREWLIRTSDSLNECTAKALRQSRLR